MPALMGWTAATGRLDLAGGLAVFGVLFFWQVPHFHAIAMYRQREYEAGRDEDATRTPGLAATRRAIVGVPRSSRSRSASRPALLGVAGTRYLVTAMVLGAVVLVQAAPDGARHARWAADRS